MATASQLKELAELRLKEAQALFDAGLYDGCVYLCGYVVELALKVRVCKALNVGDYPEFEIPNAFRTRNFDHLKLLAGLRKEIAGGNPALLANWSTAIEWKPEWRYLPAGSSNRAKAEKILNAVKEAPNGVFTWLQARW